VGELQIPEPQKVDKTILIAAACGARRADRTPAYKDRTAFSVSVEVIGREVLKDQMGIQITDEFSYPVRADVRTHPWHVTWHTRPLPDAIRRASR